MSNDQRRVDQQKEEYEEQREETSTRDVSSYDVILLSTTEEGWRNSLHDRFPFLEADYSEARAVKISSWALQTGHSSTTGKITLMSVSDRSCGK